MMAMRRILLDDPTRGGYYITRGGSGTQEVSKFQQEVHEYKKSQFVASRDLGMTKEQIYSVSGGMTLDKFNSSSWRVYYLAHVQKTHRRTRRFS